MNPTRMRNPGFDKNGISRWCIALKSPVSYGEPCRIRTCDPLIKSQLLYQLS